MKTEKISPDSQHQQNNVHEVDDFNVSYLQKKFPWFSENDIQKAINIKGPYMKNVVAYLDEKSGARKVFEELE